MSPTRKALPALAAAALLLLAGCSGFLGQELGEQRQKQVADEVAEKLQNIDTLEATLTTSIGAGTGNVTTKTHVKADLTTGEYRTRILQPSVRAGDVSLYNGSAMVSYDASEDFVRVFDVNTSRTGGLQMSLEEAFGDLVERTDIYYNGTEQVNGNEAYKVTLVPTNESTGFAESATLWVGTDRMIPVKMELSLAFGDRTATPAVTLSNVTLNQDFEQGTFTFDVPADATVERGFSVDTESFESRSALAAATDVPVPEPSVPAGLSFESATLTETSTATTATLSYSNESATLMVSASDNSVPEPVNWETVTVDGHTAYYSETGSFNRLQWNCDGTGYRVTGMVEKSTLLSVAQSIEC